MQIEFDTPWVLTDEAGVHLITSKQVTHEIALHPPTEYLLLANVPRVGRLQPERQRGVSEGAQLPAPEQPAF